VLHYNSEPPIEILEQIAWLERQTSIRPLDEICEPQSVCYLIPGKPGEGGYPRALPLHVLGTRRRQQATDTAEEDFVRLLEEICKAPPPHPFEECRNRR